MTVFILSFLVMVAIMVAMSIGVLLGGKPIKGSCGGMSALGIGTACDICGGDTRKCEEQQERQGAGNADDLAYNAVEGRSER
jgi:hypothetical protein